MLSLAVGDLAPSPLVALDESTLTRSWPNDPPLVSVLCSTYQHVDFIEDALGGFLAQRTHFPIEVIVRDDGSRDGTAEILAEYQRRYPAVIRAVLEPRNRWPEMKPLQVLRPLARGRYIALCEGDDYWCDPLKVAKQVAELERQSSATVSHHQSIMVRDRRVTALEELPPSHCRDYSPNQLRRAPWLLTNTMLFRNVLIAAHPRADRILNGDEYLRARLGEHGGAIWTPSVIPSVYRLHDGGVWSALEERDRSIRLIESKYWIAAQLLEEGKTDAGRHFALAATGVLIRSLNAEGARLGLRVVLLGLRVLAGSILRALRLRT